MSETDAPTRHARRARRLTPEEAAELLLATPLRGFHTHPADKAVGTVSNDYPELLGE